MGHPQTDLSASLEDYIKAIATISAAKQAARAKDISRRLGVNMSSVTGALRALADKGLVNYAPYEIVTLTGEGEEVAREVVRKHEGIRDFLVKVLAVDKEVAEKAACDMEHAVSPEVLNRFIQFVDYLEVCPRVGNNWAEEFGYYCEHPDEEDDCEQCLALSLVDYRERKERAGVTTTFLDQLKPGTKAKIVRLDGAGETRRRIADMGMTPGTLVEVERIAPLGDPMEIKVKGYHLSLRLVEAATVAVEPL
ncbi:MAG: metal-dependent transcriptional regulator [Candidatus Latescibacterota bacterium]|jgi:DtxR family Mn-dependent transcriptional regulator